jgi:hypothetical protein
MSNQVHPSALATLDRSFPAYERQEDATRCVVGGQSIQQMLGRRISGDCVTELLQTAFYRFAEGRIVIDDMHQRPINFTSTFDLRHSAKDVRFATGGR